MFHIPNPILHTIFFFSFLFSSHFYDSLLFHVPDFFYKTSFLLFLSFWKHFKTWVRKLVDLKVLPTKATKYRGRNRRRSDVAMVRRLRHHVAPSSVGSCPKARRWGHPYGTWVPHGAQGSNLLYKRYL
jgi:hypothetical protein